MSETCEIENQEEVKEVVNEDGLSALSRESGNAVDADVDAKRQAVDADVDANANQKDPSDSGANQNNMGQRPQGEDPSGPGAKRQAVDELKSLNVPVKKLSKSQREKMIKEFAEKDDHPNYSFKTNKNGVMTIRKRKQTVEQEINDIHPKSTLSDTQVLQAQIINLERKYIKLENKHKKLKRRVNIIDNETVVIDDDFNLTPKQIPELTSEPTSEPSSEPTYQPVIEEQEVPQAPQIEDQVYRRTRQTRRSLKSLFR